MAQPELDLSGIPEFFEPLLVTPEATLWGIWTTPDNLHHHHHVLASQGVTPVFLGNQEDMERHKEVMTTSAPLLHLPPMEEEATAVFQALERGVRMEDVLDGVRETAIDATRWRMDPDPLPQMTSWMSEDLCVGRTSDAIAIAVFEELPTWHLPMRLRVGGINDHPVPGGHAGILRHWETRWGARVLTVTQDMVEVCVTQRPTGVAEAFALASEHHAYCPEVIEGSNLMEYARALREAFVWSFSWRGVDASTL